MLLESSACLSLKTDKAGHSKAGKYPALSAASLSKGETWMASESQQAAAQCHHALFLLLHWASQCQKWHWKVLLFPDIPWTGKTGWFLNSKRKQNNSGWKGLLDIILSSLLFKPWLTCPAEVGVSLRTAITISLGNLAIVQLFLMGFFSLICPSGISCSYICLTCYFPEVSGRASPILVYNHSLGNWKQQKDVSWSFSSPRLSKASSLNFTLLPLASASWASYWPSSGLRHVSVFLLYQGSQTGHIISYKESWLSREEESLPLIPWFYPSCYSPVCRGTFIPRGHTTDMFNLLFTRTASSFPGEPAWVWLFVLGLFSPGAVFVLSFAELQEFCYGPFLQPANVLLNGSSALQNTDPSPQFDIICKSPESAL